MFSTVFRYFQKKEKSEYEKAEEAAEFIKAKINFKPKMGLVLGSGLGDFADTYEKKIVVPYNTIPHFK